MDISNKTISERQCFRICLLENIAIPMLVVPYVTMRYSGAFHTIAFVIGLFLFVLYAFIMWQYAKWMPEGMVARVMRCSSFSRKSISLFYIFRYVLRCAMIVWFFSKVAHHYMLPRIPQVLIAIPFVFICGYGAACNIEKRGRLMELLFWWMIMPLIFISVFVVSNANWITINQELLDAVAIKNQGFRLSEILKCAYYVVVLSSSIELMMYTIVNAKKHRSFNVRKIVIWIMFALTFAYVFIFGVLGQEWVARNNMAALNVMEAASVPFGLVQRMDYAVLAFWIIGVFALVSGYMFYAKNYAEISIFHKKKIKEHVIVLCLCGLIFLVLTSLYNEWIRDMLTAYLLYFDLAISLLIPICLNKGMLKKKAVTTIVTICFVGLFVSGCGKPYESKSVEKRDYVKSMSVQLNAPQEDNVPQEDNAPQEDKESCYTFSFWVMNLEEYSSNGTGKLQTDQYSCSAGSLEQAIAIYYDEKGQQLDLGHMEEITFLKTTAQDSTGFDAIIEEFSTMPFVPKSIPVYEGEEAEAVTLRERIKRLFARKQNPMQEFRNNQLSSR